ncbi:hypothetical protein [Streptomyces sp. NPDC004284]|uniref:hypothetical protein n=1 Tax=Streptomyces sp. NPDC004284 TaxID=3364695 RepID=UPI0036AE71A2
MSSHAKPRILAVAIGAALLLGGGLAAQAVADTAPKPAPVAPKVVTVPKPNSVPAKPAPAAPKVVTAPKPGAAPKPAPAAPEPVAATKPVPASTPAPAPARAGDAPRVIAPGK